MPHRDASLHILTYILEDDIEVQEIIQNLIDETGIRNVKMYTSPKEFLAELTNEISICVIDHFLPDGLTGLDVIKAVKEKNEYSYVIIMTGQDSKNVAVKYINAGVDKYIDKDDGDYLKRLIEKLKTGFAVAQKRIETERMRREWATMMHDRQTETNELISKLKQR